MCVVTSVETCRTFENYRDRESKHLQLQPQAERGIHSAGPTR